MQKVIITGVTKGIGKALCEKYLDKGYGVIGLSSNEKNLETLKNEMSSHALELFKCDIGNEQDIKDFGKFLKQENNIISLINNVGIGFYSEFVQHGNEKIQEIIDTNLLGTILLTKEVLEIKSHTLNNITFISSLAGKVGFEGLSVYSATKHGIEGFADALREELVEKGVVVLVVRPGIVDTNFFLTAKMEEYTKDLKSIMQSPEYVASEVFESRKNHSLEVTIGKDKWFLFLRRFVPKVFERKLMQFFIS